MKEELCLDRGVAQVGVQDAWVTELSPQGIVNRGESKNQSFSLTIRKEDRFIQGKSSKE